ncbi:TetR/AcrR family transcriptional regulator [Altererythrobacter ishigakiensis]|uniref:TetR family transcriptional regulator n=1 Tax=Altererythrobacter ishigakiensis TaxID=476157 RepID=A0A562UM54_9SPHN|nr:TetR/AcrR family transcriptional regulator [Altererythrobacter ishigakiensis]TWJ06692.1 TetR family transcriptional regulator [Altererythrobacter ishigakiensis]
MAKTTTNEAPPSDRREQILRETLKALGEHSYDRFSLREIAKRLSISLGNLQYYFPTKDDLFLAICERAQADYDRSAFIFEKSQASGIEGILQAFDWHVAELNRPHAVVWLILGHVAIYNLRFKEFSDQSYRVSQTTWETIIERSALKIEENEARSLAATILAMVDGFFLRNFPADLRDPQVMSLLNSLKSEVVALVEKRIR